VDVFWSFRCENEHWWEVALPSGQEPSNSDAMCPEDGEMAITKRREPPADRVGVCLLSAARVVDDVRGQVSKTDQYFIAIVSNDGVELARSARAYRWEVAIEKAAIFRDATTEMALNRWRRTGMDNP
jgi:hypothetical protein